MEGKKDAVPHQCERILIRGGLENARQNLAPLLPPGASSCQHPSSSSISPFSRLAHEHAYKTLGSFDALQRATTARIQKGKFEDQGYVYLPNIDIPLQGMDANQSWNSVAELARRTSVPVLAHFQWRNNLNAAHPGQGSTLCYQP